MVLSECLEDCPEDFAQCQVVYEAGWSDYEEAAWVVVFDFFGDLYVVSHYDSVMSTDEFYFDPQPITRQEIEDLKEEWE